MSWKGCLTPILSVCSRELMMRTDLHYVVEKLAWMRDRQIWPNGLRYLWTDAYGVILLVSLYKELGRQSYLDEAESVVADVEEVLGRPRGIRIGEAPDRDGQYFHYLTMWLHALEVLGRCNPDYRQKAIDLVRQVHEPFLVRGRGVFWKMREDLSGPYPGIGFGALDAFGGYVAYRQLDSKLLASEIADMRTLIDASRSRFVVTQDLGLGMMLWMSHFYPDEGWAIQQRRQSLNVLDQMWDERGYYCREPMLPNTKFAFTNYGVSIGLQAVGARPTQIERLHEFFETYRSGDEYDVAAITHVMACSAHFPGELLVTKRS